jgi:hypothetical protein
MAEQQMVDPHDPIMTGENSFIRLSHDGGKTIAERVSHWRVLWSPAGQGHALFIESSLKKTALYSDNPGLARWLQRTIETHLHKPFADESIAVTDATFERGGDSLSTVYERCTSTKDDILMQWWELMPPFILTMPPGAMGRPIGVYSTFLPARAAQLAVNGEAAPGKVFPQERGGRASSSCVLAWSESWVRPK